MIPRRPPPRDLGELRLRAEALAGRTIGELAAHLGVALIPGQERRHKGLQGHLVEAALGGGDGGRGGPDFPHLGVELKTIPVDGRGRVRESTFVCAARLGELAGESFADSRLRQKLACVLFLPVEAPPRPLAERRLGRPCLFRLGSDEEAILAADFALLTAAVGRGEIAAVDGHLGEALQLRPKGPSGAARTLAATGGDGEVGWTMPRGFYLRARFTQRLLDRLARSGSPWKIETPVRSC